MKKLLFLFLIFSFLMENISSQIIGEFDLLPPFVEWPISYLQDGAFHCSSKENVLYDDFNIQYNNPNGTGLNSNLWTTDLGCWPITNGGTSTDWCLSSRLHVWATEQLFLDENIEVDASNSRLIISAKNNEPSFTGAIKNSNGDWVDMTVKRDVSTGVIKTVDTYTLAEYEIKCKMPPNTNFWMAFWMWYYDEIDVIDVGKLWSFLNAVYNSPYEDKNALGNSDVAEFFDEWNDPLDVNLSLDWHTYTMRFTPYKIEFLIDGIVIEESTVYRYYTLDGEKLDLECGDSIDGGVYKVNPGFPRIEGQWFRPIVWLAVDPKCWYEEELGGGCDSPDCLVGEGCCCDHDGSPETYSGAFYIEEETQFPVPLEIDYVKISEQIYDFVSLEGGCHQLCEEEDEEIRISLNSKRLNYQPHHSNSGYYEEVLSWNVSNNVQIINQGTDFIDIAYLDLLNQSGDLIDMFWVEAEVQGDEGNSFTVKKEFYPPQKPEVMTYKFECDYYLCIDSNNNCEDNFSYDINASNVKYVENGELDGQGMDCYLVTLDDDSNCVDVTIDYETCDVTESTTESYCWDVISVNPVIDIWCFDGEFLIFEIANVPESVVENSFMNITTPYENFIIDIVDLYDSNYGYGLEEWELPAEYEIVFKDECGNIQKVVKGEFNMEDCPKEIWPFYLKVSPNPASNQV